MFAIGGEKYNSLNEISTRKSGCAALDLAYVASGRLDGYFQKNLHIWDIAAGILLGLSSFVNFHVFNSSKNNLPPNKTIMKIATMSGRGLLVIVLIAAAIAFY